MRKFVEILQKLVGPEVGISSTRISRCAQKLDEGLETWRNRPLEETPYLLLDARYESRSGGGLRRVARRGRHGHRRMLGISVALSEAEAHWRTFLDSLIKRSPRGSSSSPATITPNSKLRARACSLVCPAALSEVG
jgi:putative transposase